MQNYAMMLDLSRQAWIYLATSQNDELKYIWCIRVAFKKHFASRYMTKLLNTNVTKITLFYGLKSPIFLI